MYKSHLLRMLSTGLIISLQCGAPAAGTLSCGTDANWVSTCSAGTQTLNVTMNFGLDTDFSSLANVDVSFTGEVIVKIGDPYASDPVNAPGHIDRINTEIISMSLMGSTSYVNGWGFRMGVDQAVAPSLGFIQEQINTTIALSRFDTVFEIDSIPYGTLTHDLNATVFFEDLISGLPEIGAKYNHTGAPFGTTIPLFDENGIEVLRLTDLIVTDFVTIGRPHFIVDSVVIPVPPAIWLFGSGLLGLISLSRRNRYV